MKKLSEIERNVHARIDADEQDALARQKASAYYAKLTGKKVNETNGFAPQSDQSEKAIEEIFDEIRAHMSDPNYMQRVIEVALGMMGPEKVNALRQFMRDKM